MQDNTYIFIMNHGRFGEELIRSAELIIGAIDRIQAISLVKGMSLDELVREAGEKFAAVSGQIIVLTDMFGGTPNNVAMMLQEKFKLEVLCGVNLPMLISIAMARGVQPPDELASCGLQAAKESLQRPQIREFEEMEEM